MGTTLVVNPGSSSRKYALYCDGGLVLEIIFENTKTGFEMCSRTSGSQHVCESIKKEDFNESFARVAEDVDKQLFRESAGKLENVVVRIVAPGTYFQQHAEITDAYIEKLKGKESVAQLHIPIILREIAGVKKHFRNVRLIGASDSAFHAGMPSKAREYSINSADAHNLDIHRFGYHGLSVASVVRRIHALIGIDPERMIVCHVGNGASVTAVKHGVSVDTSMGFSPTSGLPMGSRAGDLDAGALLEIMRIKHWRPNDAELYINTSCGLTGLAKEPDIRHLLERRSQKDPAATHALDVFAYQVQKEVAAQTVALGGLDVLVLTATAATRSVTLRNLILSGLDHFGIKINEERNEVLIGKDGVISARNSQVKVVVMRTDEMGEMAQVVTELDLKPV